MSAESVALRIRDAMERVSKEQGRDPWDVRGIAKALDALPVMGDSGGLYLLRPNGEVISIAWDKPHDWELEADGRIRNTVLHLAVERFGLPDELRPTRPADAAVCPSCEGSGRVKHAAHPVLEKITCFCGGLGWVPPGMRWSP